MSGKMLEVNVEVAENGQPFTMNVNSKKVLEQDVIPVTTVTTTATLTTTKRTVSRCSEMEIWFGADVEDIAGGDTLTVNFYKIVNGTEYLAEVVSVTVPAVTKSQSAKADVVPVSADIESFDAYQISGAVTVVNGGGVKILVGKKSQG